VGAEESRGKSHAGSQRDTTDHTVDISHHDGFQARLRRAGQDPMDYDFADILSTLLHGWWGIRSMSNTLVNSIMQCLSYHVGIQKVVWDEDLEGGLGDVRVDDIDPRDVFGR